MKIALVCSDDFSFWIFRRGLIKRLVSEGHEVYLLGNDGPYVERLVSLGVRYIPINCNRFISPLRDLRLCLQLYRAFRRHRFEVVHNFTIKLNIFGSITARLARVTHVYASATGAGYYLDPEYEELTVLRRVIISLYGLGCKACTKIWFQNPESIQAFHQLGIITDKSKTVLVRSSGVDLEEFGVHKVEPGKLDQIRAEVNLAPEDKVVVKVARPVWPKGIKEYLELSQSLYPFFPNLHFLLVGDCEEDNPELVPAEYLRTRGSPNFHWLGWRTDIRDILALSDLVVQCSYPYMEGVPRALLEAMAMNKAIVATDVDGCREVVDQGNNGYLVPARDVEAMAEAVKGLVADSDKLVAFGRRSRAKVEAEFDEKLIVEELTANFYRF